ncbi:glutamine--fructose-6-phosphate transaminase (isomerizing) [Pseudonocardiaceae bacterium YIM PH 21723]|nr:glutamine--fructose-6-phosphate transaminase (isomerizing) [Pseudonocardiaceae bacterium YIM PH 21723]
MCGIVGYVGSKEAAPVLLEGLHRLEYRGYDSAGVALVNKGRLKITKAAVRVNELRNLVGTDAPSTIGIAHTRWATHGPATDANAHPHTDADSRIVLVHNGIVENYEDLKAQLLEAGAQFKSETDTEVLAHLVGSCYLDGISLEEAVRTALRRVEGTYGLVVMDPRKPEELVVARNGSPIVLGVGDGEMFVASDVAALVRHTQRVVFLDDGEMAVVRAGDFRTFTLDASSTTKEPTLVDASDDEYQLGTFPDFFSKELHEQPAAVDRALRGRLDEQFATVRLGGIGLDPHELRTIQRVKFLGCGTSYYAGMVGANLVEELARIPADAEPASEFRYRNPVVDPDCLYVAISQSGETLDTLAAITELKRKGGKVMGAVNVIGSAIARECGSGVFLHSGPEVSVASTKAFTNMMVSFAMLGLMLGRVRDLSVASGKRMVTGLRALPGQITEILQQSAAVEQVAAQYAGSSHMFYIGRNRCWPIAREGALKLKEISYIHAEAYQAGELKHGPLALIDETCPSVIVIPDDELLAKNISSIEQIKARGGAVIAITNTTLPEGLCDAVITVPKSEPELDPVLLNIPLQLFAYHVATKLGRDIDKPRNLAKSVTVE